MPKVLITGANGFIGRALTNLLLEKGYDIVAASRELNTDFSSTVTPFRVSDLSNQNWSDALEQTDCIIHLAGRVHILNESIINPLEEFYKINTLGTLNLAQQAVKSNVKRFIFISSIGVNGNQTLKPFREQDTPSPVDPYAISKHQAEQGLKKIAKETGLEVVIIRPPLVYGKNAPGNFKRLIDIVYKSIPLPLGAINNKRSLIYIDNLVDLIANCVEHPKASNQTFLVSDDNDISTTDLIKNIAKALNRKIILIPIPMPVIKIIARIFGKQNAIQKLCGSLQIDISHTKKTLDWKPPYTFNTGMQEVANAYLEKNRKS